MLGAHNLSLREFIRSVRAGHVLNRFAVGSNYQIALKRLQSCLLKGGGVRLYHNGEMKIRHVRGVFPVVFEDEKNFGASSNGAALLPQYLGPKLLKSVALGGKSEMGAFKLSKCPFGDSCAFQGDPPQSCGGPSQEEREPSDPVGSLGYLYFRSILADAIAEFGAALVVCWCAVRMVK